MHAQKTYDIAGCCRPGYNVDDKPQSRVQVTGSSFARISWISTTLMQCTLRYPGWSLCAVRSKKRIQKCSSCSRVWFVLQRFSRVDDHLPYQGTQCLSKPSGGRRMMHHLEMLLQSSFPCRVCGCLSWSRVVPLVAVPL